MRRIGAAVLFAAMGFGAARVEQLPLARPMHAAAAEWLGANAMSGEPQTVAGIELAAGLSPLDAALIVRAVERFHPAGIVFLEPIANAGDVSLLESRLSTANLPMVFTGSQRLHELPGISVKRGEAPVAEGNFFEPQGRPIAAGPAKSEPGVFVAGVWKDRAVPSVALELLILLDHLASPSVSGAIPGTIRAGSIFAPVDANGYGQINELAAAYTQTISFEELMVQIERSERGEVSPELDGLFRNRIVAVSRAGARGAEGLAALRNNLVEGAAPPWAAGLAIALLASLPWWARGVAERVVRALLAVFVWLLLALAVYQQYRVTPSLLPMALAPLLALIPLRAKSHEAEKREAPAEDGVARGA